MRTACLLTVSQHALGGGGGVSQHALGRGGVYPSMHWAGGCIPACHAGGGVCTGRGICTEGRCLPRGCVADTPPGPEASTPLDRMTDACKNSTLPQLRLRAVIIKFILVPFFSIRRERTSVTWCNHVKISCFRALTWLQKLENWPNVSMSYHRN